MQSAARAALPLILASGRPGGRMPQPGRNYPYRSEVLKQELKCGVGLPFVTLIESQPHWLGIIIHIEQMKN